MTRRVSGEEGPRLPVPARRLPETAGEGAAELAGRAEPRGKRDVEHGKRSLAEELAGAVETEREIVGVHAAAEAIPEQPFELPERDAGEAGEFLARLRRLEVRLHGAEDGEQASRR